MKLFIGIVGALIVSCLAGWIAYVRSDSATASYIIGVISLAVAAVGVVIPFCTPVGKWMKSKVKVKVRDAKESTVIGKITRKKTPGPTSVNVNARGLEKSKVIGVEEK